jgi:hypothetical protein
VNYARPLAEPNLKIAVIELAPEVTGTQAATHWLSVHGRIVQELSQP